MYILTSQTLSEEELIKLALKRNSQVEKNIKERLLHWDFGPVMNLTHDSKAKNYLFSSERVPLHWDGAFYQEPRELLFYCTSSDGAGGETFFVDTNKVWEILPQSLKRACESVELLYRTKKLAHYGGEFKTSVVKKHPRSGLPIIRLAERVETELNPVELEIKGIQDSEEFYQEMKRYLYDERAIYYHQWTAGDLLLVDNFTYLHGRNELGPNLKRSFKRVQIL